jgi:hypothetical protein
LIPIGLAPSKIPMPCLGGMELIIEVPALEVGATNNQTPKKRVQCSLIGRECKAQFDLFFQFKSSFVTSHVYTSIKSTKHRLIIKLIS